MGKIIHSIKLRHIVLFVIYLLTINNSYAGKRETEKVNVGDQFTVYTTYHSYTNSVLWHWDTGVLELVGSLSGTSTSATFKVKKASPISGVVIQATTYYFRNGTTSSGLNKDLDTWQVFATDNSTVNISATSIVLSPGESTILRATVSNSSYSGNYSWTSTNNSVAYTRGQGNSINLYANKPGNATIRVTLDNGKYAECDVTVRSVDVSSASISPSSMNIDIDDIESLFLSTHPNTATVNSTNWYSTSPSVATVNSSGTVTGKSEGRTEIYCVVNGNVTSNSCLVTVNKPSFYTEKTWPEANSKEQKVTVKPYITFCRYIYPGTSYSKITLTDESGNFVSGSCSISGAKLTFTPEKSLTPQTIYTLSIPSSAVVDKYDNANSPFSITFTTGDREKLTIKTSITEKYVSKGDKVALSTNASEADIYYTTDGTTPSRTSKKYTSPISIEEDVTLKAKAFCDGYDESDIFEHTYRLSALSVVATYPNKNSEVGDYASVLLSYNLPIDEGSNYNDIKLLSDGKDVDGEIFISDNTLYYVPNSKLKKGYYTFVIPQNSLKRKNSDEECTKYELSFSVCSNGKPYPIDYGGLSGQYVIKSDNSLWIWGMFPHSNDSWTYIYTPTQFYFGGDVISATTGDVFVAAITKDGSLWCRGQNGYGQLGLGHTDFVSTATKVTDNVKCVAADNHMLILKNDGTVWSCGYNYCGQLGNGKTGTTTNPTLQKVPIEDVDTVATAFQISAAIKKDGTLWTWGRGEYIGTGGTSDKTSPVKILSNVRSVSLCGMLSYAIKNDNSLWMWGNKETPKKIMDNVLYVKNGNYRTHIIKTDGKLYSWGQNDYGQLGDGTKNSTGWSNSYDKAVCVFDDVQKVNVSMLQATGAMKTDGSIWTWGTNTYGSLGYSDNRETVQLTPKLLMEGKDTVCINDVSFLYDVIDTYVGGNVALPLILDPCDADYTNISYTIDDSSVATIMNNGIVTALSCGSTNVCASITDLEGNVYDAYYKINVEAQPTGIETINNNSNSISVIGYYDLNGRKLTAPQKGLNIIHYSDGSVQKIICR